MLQQNSFFSQGFIFFGPQLQLDDEEFDEDEDEWEGGLLTSLESDFGFANDSQIGLYIDWSSLEETD